MELKQEMNRLLDQRKELLASLKYASFIQRAILPEQREMEQALEDHFILYKPRDIISGDFYYCTRKEQQVIVAVGDCTGHGVPGALMSIMGVSFLNEILSGRGPMTPSRILNLLRERVMRALRQRGNELENKDAMDMALCVYTPESGKLLYAGANNPLYLVRKGKLNIFGANKMPVGIDAFEENSFTSKEVQLKKGDIVYLFSDGYPDQFGGEYGKKFKYGPFRDLLCEVSKLDMDQQKLRLDTTISDWMGDQAQIDDITIFGIRF